MVLYATGSITNSERVNSIEERGRSEGRKGKRKLCSVFQKSAPRGDVNIFYSGDMKNGTYL